MSYNLFILASILACCVGCAQVDGNINKAFDYQTSIWNPPGIGTVNPNIGLFSSARERYLPRPQLVANYASDSWNEWSNSRNVAAPEVEMKNGLAYFREERQPFTGNVRAYYPNGELASVLTIEHGKIIGAVCKTPDGSIASSFSRGSGQLQTYYPSGKIKTISLMRNSVLFSVRTFNEYGQYADKENSENRFSRLASFWWEPQSN